MDIEVQGGADVGVAQENAHGFVVAFAFDAAGGEAVPKAMKPYFGQAELMLERDKISAVLAGLNGFRRIG